ncbi:MAG: hypothetical protein SGJ18_08655 [Pseudomonadota bacterium]|nr:hypothetical protein [Pseudomonadota bacterium]
MRFVLFLFLALTSNAPRANAADTPSKTGKDAAAEYFKEQKRTPAATNTVGGEHYLGIHIGNHLSSTAYRWGPQKREKGVAKFSGGLTYRFGEWVNFGDSYLRVDFSSYEFASGNRATKMSVLAAVLLPDISSQFPFYFGAGIGPGVFFKQLEGESALSLDYQLLLGLRFLNLIDSVGFFVETGLQNHIHILSDGQLNSSYLIGGVLFSF